VGARVATLSTADLFDHFQMVRPDNLLHVDFGEVITCHSAQGSQWEHVGLVWDSTARFMLAKDLTNGTAWLYTAVTRAKTTFTVFDL
jgi:ATP-dependent exoDNAse (exonuclease V) alpha subunit